MLPATVATTIRTRLTDEWSVSHSDVPLFWEGENNQLPNPPFVHVEIRFGAARIAGLGGPQKNTHRQSGEVIIRLFEESLYGMERVRGLADDAADILRTWISGELRFYTAAPSGSGGELSGNVSPLTVIASFEFDLVD